MSDSDIETESEMDVNDVLGFEEDGPRDAIDPSQYNPDELLLNIDGYEGPIDILLVMARDQKVDLAKISILQLTRQYLEFMERAKALNLDLAAEYLVMAAWLAYLKSRLLLPREETANGNQPSADQMAEALQFQLRRLESMKNAAVALFRRPYLGNGIYGRGTPEGLAIKTDITWDVSLFDLLKAYGEIRRRQEFSTFELPTFSIMTMEEALDRVGVMLGKLPRKGPYSAWVTMDSLMPEKVKDPLYGRSSRASTFTAGLELVKQGKVEIKQDGLFRPIYLRASYIDRDKVAAGEISPEDFEDEEVEGNANELAADVAEEIYDDEVDGADDAVDFDDEDTNNAEAGV